MAIADNTNYALTGAQIKDLVSKIPVITVTDVDPGEGSPLAENHFIAIY